MARGGSAGRHSGADRAGAAARRQVRRFHRFHPGAGGADHGRGRRAQHPGRPDRAGLARACRFLRHRRLYGRHPDAQGDELLDRVPARRRRGGRGRLRAGAAGLARERALSRHGHHRVRLHRPARDDRVARPDRRRQRPDGSRAAVDRIARIRRTRPGDARGRARRRVALSLSPIGPQRLGHGDGGGARRRGGGALDRPQSGDRQDRGVRAVRGVHRSRRSDLRAAVDVRRAGFVPVLAVDPVPVRGDRGRDRLGVRAGGRRRGQRGAAGASLRSRRVSPPVLRRRPAGDPVGGAGRRARDAGRVLATPRAAAGRGRGLRCRGVPAAARTRT